MAAARTDRLSVGDVAALVGVTPRTVRHYHQIGLLPEPERDSSGYRRYGGKEVVSLVRVTRLRALGMPLAQIAQRLAETGTTETSFADDLRTLAGEIDSEIGRMTATRDRLRQLAESETFEQPVKALTQVLQDRGVLGPADQLRAGEGWAATVLDALHPEGMPGVLAQADRLFADSSTVSELRPLRRRLGRLGEHTPDSEIAALADDVAAVLPRTGVDASLINMHVVELLLTERLNATQQRFIDELRSRLENSR